MDAESFEMEEAGPGRCTHPSHELRLRTLSNKATAVQYQCTVCGDAVGGAIKKASITAEQLKSLPAWDTELQETYREIANQHWREMRERQQAEWDAESPARKAAYTEYLKSPEWRAKREQVLRRDNYICQGCLSARATQVHHLTYKHRGNELLWELVSACDDCHRRAHE